MVLHSLRNDNIQDVRGFVEDIPDIIGPAIVSKYYEKGSLHDVLRAADQDDTLKKANELKWNVRVGIALDISKGIVYLHSKNPPMIHRDLKAANCFIDSNWKACIGDFGFTKPSDFAGKVGPGDGPGNPRWLAPEMRREKSMPTPASDVYSFGMILYELLAFSPPYGKIYSHVQLYNAILLGKKPDIPDPERLVGVKEDNCLFGTSGAYAEYVNLMEACWCNDYSKRPLIQDVHDRLEHILKLYNKAVKANG